MQIVNCKRCSQPVRVSAERADRPTGVFCSWECRTKKTAIACGLCGKIRMVKASISLTPTKIGRFCSTSCRARAAAKRAEHNSRYVPRVVQYCSICGTPAKRRKSVAQKHQYLCSKECIFEFHSRRGTGPNNSSWLGGKSFEPYPSEWTTRFRNAIRMRDGNKCRMCGKTEQQNITDAHHRLAVHHIDYDKENLDPSNLVSLCSVCHAKTNFDRESWTALLRVERSQNHSAGVN